MILRLTSVHEDRVILSEAKNLALLRIGPRSKDQGEILRFAQNDSAFSWQRRVSAVVRKSFNHRKLRGSFAALRMTAARFFRSFWLVGTSSGISEFRISSFDIRFSSFGHE